MADKKKGGGGGGDGPVDKAEETKKNQTVGNYNLGVTIGKGGFATVYQGLDIENGDFVAIKQINLNSKIPKEQLQGIMNEIDLLKNLNHPNIVKYIKYVKTKDSLYIVLEYVENGSLSSLIKKFGKFPESLVCVYIRQVLEGLVYLHEQGVVHRDIKGANILTTKEGKIKLADFGVATKFDDKEAMSVIGTPYWMAPEIIELNGATTKSDIWSVGCTVIELLTGSPPYYDLGQMPALFRIVSDDYPPLPEGISPALRDWLMQCFQKDPNLRISAQKLLKHRWLTSNAKKAEATSLAEPLSNIDDIAKNIQDYNERIKPKAHMRKPSIHPKSPKAKINLPPPEEDEDDWGDDFDTPPVGKLAGATKSPPQKKLQLPGKSTTPVKQPVQPPKPATPVKPESEDDMDWDSDFATVSDLTKALNQKSGITIEDDDDDNFDDDFPTVIKINNNPVGSVGSSSSSNNNNSKPIGSALKPSLKSPGSTGSSTNVKIIGSKQQQQQKEQEIKNSIGQWGDNDKDNDDDDWGDVPTTAFDKSNLMRKGSLVNSSHANLNQTGSAKPSMELKLKNRMTQSHDKKGSFGDDDEDDEDPFSDDFDDDDFDLDKNLQKDNYSRMSEEIIKLMNQLQPNESEETLSRACDQLITMFKENSEQKTLLIRRHGVIPIMEMLEVSNINSNVLCSILKVVNQIIDNNMEIQENLCLVGGIPAIMKFSTREYPSSVRLETASFISKMCSTSTLTLQMFIACKGLPILVDFLLSNFNESKKLVVMAIDAIINVFELQSPTPKNDFCRLFSKCGLLKTLPVVLRDVIQDGELAATYPDKIINLFIMFSSADSVVRKSMSSVEVIRTLLDSLQHLTSEQLVKVLKSIRQISMDHNTLINLQNAGTIRTLVPYLGQRTGAHIQEIHNQILNTMFYILRLDSERQYQAAVDGIIPHLQFFIRTKSNLNQFALPIIIDLGHSKKSRVELWKHDGVHFYLDLLEEKYWQVNALESLASWLSDETSRVEKVMSEPESIEKIINAYSVADGQSFSGLLESLLKIISTSKAVNILLGTSTSFMPRVLEKLSHTNPGIRLSLLKIITSLYEAHPNPKKMIQEYKLYPIIKRISETDKAVLVVTVAKILFEAFNTNSVI